MKSFYLVAFIGSVIAFLLSILIPADSNLAIDRRLSIGHDKWQILYNTSDHKLLGADEESSKRQLLKYLENHRFENTFLGGPYGFSALIAAIFSAIGIFREKKFSRKAQQDAAANP